MRLATAALSVVVALYAATQSTAQQLTAVLVADTDASNIGESVKADLIRLKDTLQRGLPANKLRIIEYTGQEVTKGNISRTLREVRVGRTGALLMYFSGHGGYDLRRGHYLVMDGTDDGRLYRDDVVDAITRPHTPRFWALITDCCASVSRVAAAPAWPQRNTTLLSHLFLETDGRLDITSSRPEQMSLGLLSGGVFTMSLCGVLNENASKRLDWKEVFLLARAETSRAAESFMADDRTPHMYNGIEQRTQIPYSFRTMYGESVNGLRLGIYLDDTRITSIRRNSPASRVGLSGGMIVRSVNSQDVSTSSQVMTGVNFSPRQARIIVNDGGAARAYDVELAY